MRASAPFGVGETHGVLGQKPNKTAASSDNYNWNSIYASSQSEFPFEAFFSAVDDQLLVLHRSGPVSVDRLKGDKAQRCVVPAGGIHLVPGGTSFGFRLFEQLDTLHVYVRRAVIEEVAAEMAIGDPTNISVVGEFVDSDVQMNNLLQAVMFALEDADYANALYVDCLARAVASRLVRNYSNARLRQSSPSDSMSSGALGGPIVNEAIAYMRENLDRSIGLDDIAAVINRSPSHFARQFRNEMGTPPYQYLVNLRLDKAQSLLRETRMSVAEVAFECGFTHQEHLTRLFRRRFQTTPAAYRKSCQN
jgi:AraC family transcriptional regulator